MQGVTMKNFPIFDRKTYGMDRFGLPADRLVPAQPRMRLMPRKG